MIRLSQVSAEKQEKLADDHVGQEDVLQVTMVEGLPGREFVVILLNGRVCRMSESSSEPLKSMD